MQASTFTFLFVCVSFLASSPFSCAAQKAEKTFLGRRSLEAAAEEADPALLHRLVSEVEGALGGSIARHHLGQIEEMLRPTFWALPKNEHGKLDHAAVRYALHRLFVQRRGWVIRGFHQESISEAWNQSSAAQLLQGRVPGLVQEIFEKRVGEKGSSLHDVAVLAALYEHLIHDEMRTRLQGTYEISGIPTDAVLDAEKAESVMELYMMFFIQGYTDLHAFTPEDLEILVERYPQIYPAWPRAVEMLHQATEAAAPGLQQFTFEDMSKVLEEASHRLYDLVHHAQCQYTKDMLMEMEDRNSGRVRLLDFYRAAIYENKYQFTETIDYLRQIGTLDESDAKMPRVIIPNYVSGPSNCIARTSYYAVCCPDDCENRYDHLEHVLKRPQATPAAILAWIADDETEPLSDLMIQRLHSIAAHHDGEVPLHGRLFAQWMHFAHPHSCVYPHVSGTTYTKTLEEWEEDTGGQAGATVDQILDWEQHLSKDHEAGQEGAAKDDAIWLDASDMWTMEEELITVHPDTAARLKGGGASTEESASDTPSLTLAKGALFVAVFGVALAFLGRGQQKGTKCGHDMHYMNKQLV